VAPEREREVFLLPRQGGKESCELGVHRSLSSEELAEEQ
jgi:hypothetical protein